MVVYDEPGKMCKRTAIHGKDPLQWCFQCEYQRFNKAIVPSLSSVFLADNAGVFDSFPLNAR